MERTTIPSLQQVYSQGENRTDDATLRNLSVLPIPFEMAREIIVRHHYLHAWPGATELAFGVFAANQLLGSLILGAGSPNGYRIVRDAGRDDCLTLSRLWLSDELPRNSESKAIGEVVRALRQSTTVKFLISYADPSQGHVGTIYQATNWLYTGLSALTPMYDLGDGVSRHPRSVAGMFGTRSKRHFTNRGMDVLTVPQSAKHRYVIFINRRWRRRLNVRVLPYPKKGDRDGNL